MCAGAGQHAEDRDGEGTFKEGTRDREKQRERGVPEKQ